MRLIPFRRVRRSATGFPRVDPFAYGRPVTTELCAARITLQIQRKGHRGRGDAAIRRALPQGFFVCHCISLKKLPGYFALGTLVSRRHSLINCILFSPHITARNASTYVLSGDATLFIVSNSHHIRSIVHIIAIVFILAVFLLIGEHICTCGWILLQHLMNSHQQSSNLVHMKSVFIAAK